MTDTYWTLTRFAYLPNGTLGVITRPEAARSIYTIERPWLNNTPYVSCVPEGEYMLQPFSGRRWKGVLELIAVKDRTVILLHIANKPEEVQGCIGPGFDWRINNQQPSVLKSRLAVNELIKDYEDNANDTWISITSTKAVL